jgi:CheY-like chemotaxis protein
LHLLVEIPYQPGGVNPSEVLLADTAGIVDTRLMHSWQQQQSTLGLAIVLSQGLARVLGGNCEVSVSNTAGKPSTIMAAIPFTMVSPKPQITTTSAVSTAAPPASQQPPTRATGISTLQVPAEQPGHRDKVILVVDDSEINRSLHARLVKRLGYTAEVCSDGDEVLGFLQNASKSQRDIALIMMDIVMPRMNGVDCCRLLRSRGYRMPILAVTANASHGDCAKLLEQGFNDLLPKPFTMAALRDILARFVT